MGPNEHWASDILPAAALGYYTGKKIESMFFPVISGENISLLCYYSF